MSNKLRKNLGFIDYLMFIIAVFVNDEDVINYQFNNQSIFNDDYFAEIDDEDATTWIY